MCRAATRRTQSFGVANDLVRRVLVAGFALSLGGVAMTAQAAQCYADPVLAYEAMIAERVQAQKVAARININTATAAQFATLQGVGVKTAEEIVLYREMFGEFARIEDLMKVRGVGKATLEKNRARLAVLD